MQRVAEGGLIPRGFSYGANEVNNYVYRMLYFRWDGKQRRCPTHDLYVSPGINIMLGYYGVGWKLRPRFEYYFFYNCTNRQEERQKSAKLLSSVRI